MNNRIIRTSEINVLVHLLSEENMMVILYGPLDQFLSDEEHKGKHALFLAEVEDLCDKASGKKIAVFNLTNQPVQFSGVDFIIDFERLFVHQGKFCTRLNYICNADGSMRWLFPVGMKKPFFLAFYNFSYWKAAIYKIVIRLLFWLHLSRFVSKGSLFIHSREVPFFKQLCGQDIMRQKSFSIFTGTRGPNRKVIIAVADSRKISHFFKIALNSRSRTNIRNEYLSLESLATTGFRDVTLPKAVMSGINVIRIENIKPSRFFTEYLFGNRQALFLNRLYENDHQVKPFSDLKFCRTSRERLSRIKNHARFYENSYFKELYVKLLYLQSELESRTDRIPVARCHGDFTRWNMYQDINHLYVYDWELSQPEMPLLMDLFHYVIQVAIFSVHADFDEIELRIARALDLAPVKEMIGRYSIDPVLHLQLYLLENTGYYLELYLDQPVQHQEMQWQFKTWDYLLFTHTAYQQGQSHRIEFIKDLFVFLKFRKYCLLKSAGKSMNELSYTSDIDLLATPETAAAVLFWLKDKPRIQKCITVKKSFMTTVQIYFMDSSFLSIDFLHQFHRKSIAYLDSMPLLERAVVQENVKLLSPVDDFLYIYIFYLVNYSAVPEKYSRHFSGLPSDDENRILRSLKKQFGIVLRSLSETFTYDAETRKTVMRYICRKTENRPLARMGRSMLYLVDQLRDLAKHQGFMLTFSGVDGAGKTTILQEVKAMLESKYRRKVVVIRHRPSFLPILSAWKYGKAEADQRCVDRLPRKGKNANALSSLLRFGYYYADYFFGQVGVYLKYTMRGWVVLYDRYYFDFIVDARRSNLSVNRSFVKGLFRFVYKPELNIFLYAKPEVILQRKKELSATDILELTGGYKKLFSELGTKETYLCIENLVKSETIGKIEKAFVHIK